MAVQVARGLNIPDKDLYQFEAGALLHDIGKIGVPDDILKKAGRLTAEEKALMDKHPNIAGGIKSYTLI